MYKKKSTNKNKKLDEINSGLSDLKDEIEEMSEGEIEIEKPYKKVDIVENIFEFNLSKTGFFEGSFSWRGRGNQFDPRLHISRKTYLISI